MTNTHERNWLITVSIMIMALLSIGFMAMFAKSILVPFVIALFIIIMVSPLMDFLTFKCKLPGPLTSIISLLVVLAVWLLVFTFIYQAINTIIATTGMYSNSFISFIGKILEKASALGFPINKENIISQLKGYVPSLLSNSFGTAVGLLSSASLVAIFVLFLILGKDPNVRLKGIYSDIDFQVRKYVITKTMLSTVTGLLVWISLKIIGIDLAAIFGLLAFMLNFIPSIGSVIATIIPIPIAAAQFQNPWIVVYVIAIPGTIQMVVGNFVEPRLTGKELNLHPVTILLALAFWGLLWGIAGMFLAVPMTTICRAILIRFDTLRPVGDLLAGKLPEIKDS